MTVGALLVGVVGLGKTDAGTGTFLIGLFQLWVGVALALVLIALFRHTLFPASLENDIRAYETQHAP